MHQSVEARLKSGLWVKAHVRQCFSQDMPAFILFKGDEDRGGILLKVDHFDGGYDLLEQSSDFNGKRIWRRLIAASPNNGQQVTEKVMKRRSYDDDLWVVEIEDQKNQHSLEDPIED